MPIPSRQTGMDGHAFDQCSIMLPSSAGDRSHLGNVGSPTADGAIMNESVFPVVFGIDLDAEASWLGKAAENAEGKCDRRR